MVAKTPAKVAAASKNGKTKVFVANASSPSAKRSDLPEIDQVTSGDSTVSEQSEGHDTGNSLATESVGDTSADGSKIYSKSIASDREDAADKKKKCSEILTSEEDHAEKKVHVKEEAKHREDAVVDKEEEGDGDEEKPSEELLDSNDQEDEQRGDNQGEEDGAVSGKESNCDEEEDEEEIEEYEGKEEGGDNEEEEEGDNEDDDREEKEEISTATSRRSMRGRPSSCVFVASLSAMHSDDHLCNSVNNHFKQWGDITLVKVLRDQVNRPYAFVQYTNDNDAANALAGAQHNTLDGRTIRCEPARVNRTLFVTPLNDDLANDTTVQEFLGQYGELEELVYSNLATAGTKKPHSWFAKFAYRDDAIRAYAVSIIGSGLPLELLTMFFQSLRLDNVCYTPSPSTAGLPQAFSSLFPRCINTDVQDWSAEWAQNLEGPNDNRGTIDKQSIFVGQLDSEVTKERLIDRFSRHGTIIDCNLIIRHPDPSKMADHHTTHRNYSFAFVKFEQEEAAAEAVEQEVSISHFLLVCFIGIT